MRYYAYCVAAGLSEIDDYAPGILDRPVEVVSFDKVCVVVSPLEDDAVAVSRENVLRHEAVVRRVLETMTPLPFRFGTMVTKENLQSYVEVRGSSLVARLNAVRGCVEMSVKVIWSHVFPERPATKESLDEDVGVGAAFLLSKRKELLGDEKLSLEAKEISQWLDDLLSGVPRNQQVNVQPKEKLVFAGSYLVEQLSVPEFRARLLKAESIRPELHFLTSGPWPPYTFANIDLEFKTQFGVS